MKRLLIIRKRSSLGLPLTPCMGLVILLNNFFERKMTKKFEKGQTDVCVCTLYTYYDCLCSNLSYASRNVLT